MLYVDAVTDANVKGMGQQVACVRYNTVTSFLDVVFLWSLLPRFGLWGYYLSFLVTHAPQFWAQLFSDSRRSLGFGLRVRWCSGRWAPWPSAYGWPLCCPRSGGWGGVLLLGAGFCSVFFLLLVILGVVGREDLHWIRGWCARLTNAGRQVYHKAKGPHFLRK